MLNQAILIKNAGTWKREIKKDSYEGKEVTSRAEWGGGGSLCCLGEVSCGKGVIKKS